MVDGDEIVVVLIGDNCLAARILQEIADHKTAVSQSDLLLQQVSIPIGLLRCTGDQDVIGFELGAKGAGLNFIGFMEVVLVFRFFQQPDTWFMKPSTYRRLPETRGRFDAKLIVKPLAAILPFFEVGPLGTRDLYTAETHFHDLPGPVKPREVVIFEREVYMDFQVFIFQYMRQYRTVWTG